MEEKLLNSIKNKQALIGRTKIAIPVDELNINNLKKYLPIIMQTFLKNKAEIDYLDNYTKGVQDVRFKTKEVRTNINHKFVENHAFEIVEFLKGYLVGKPIQYSQRMSSTLVDDIAYLNTYMTEQEKAKKDTEMIEWIAKSGKALFLTLPKTEEIENLDKEAPFKTILIDPRERRCNIFIRNR